MNRKKGKRPKNNCNSINKIDSGQEVLVLPPNILQKLGINLGKMCGNEDSSAVFNRDVSRSKVPTLSNEELFQQEVISTEKNKESSIIETANLMKKSVFLSPTFNMTHSIVLANNLEFESTTNPENLFIENMLDKNKNSKTKNIKYYDDNSQDITTHKNLDDSLNETFNSTSKESVNSLNEESASEAKTVNKNKINILSEEIVNTKKLSSLGPLIDVHDRKALVPIPIDTFISIGKHHNDSKVTLNNNTHNKSNTELKAINLNPPSESSLTTENKKGTITIPEKIEETNGEISTNNITEIAKDSEALTCFNLKSRENICEKLISSDSDAIANFQNYKQESTNTSILVNNKTCDDPDITETLESKTNEEYFNSGASVKKDQLGTVETIANILFQHLKREKQSNIEKSSDHKIFFASQESQAKSKLSVQGVEKPGGEIKLNRPLEFNPKTYARNRKNNIANKCLNTHDHAVNLDTRDIQIDCAKAPSYTPVQIPKQYCICLDFGYLEHYVDYENYAHPHFSNSKNCSSLDEVLSIYIEDTNNTINRVDCDNINLEETTDSDFQICYNALHLNSDIKMEFMDLNTIVDKSEDISTPKAKTSLIVNDKSNLFENSHSSKEDHKKPAQESPEALTVQSMQLHGFETLQTDIDTKKDGGAVKKKRKLSLSDNEKSKKNCENRKKCRKSSRVSNNKADAVSNTEDSDKLKDSESMATEVPPRPATVEMDVERDVRCAVCGARVPAGGWCSHAAGHAYLAWVDGVPPLDVTDKKTVRKHLAKICNEVGSLTCSKCTAEEKNVASYLAHTKQCEYVEASNSNSAEQSTNSGAGERVEEADVVQCGVCDAQLRRGEWATHAAHEHNYLAWIHGQPKIDVKNDDAVYNHLYHISKEMGGLMCAKCGRRRKYVKAYLNHVESCKGADALDTSVADSLNQSIASIDTTACESNITIDGGDTKDEKPDVVECGVCGASVAAAAWCEHARTSHDYLAWKHGQTPLDTSDKNAVESHLKQILKETGDLICGKCDEKRKYIKSFLRHVRSCGTSDKTIDSSVNNTLNISETGETRRSSGDDDVDSEVKCGVCGERVRRAGWNEHARTRHKYLAWRDGQTPLALDDDEEVFNHLMEISKKYHGLKCNKCGKTMKYVKVYLLHEKTCDANSASALAENKNLDVFECGVCAEKVKPAHWKGHAMSKHYNVAWVVGETPIDIKNPSAVEKYLKDYKRQYNKLECKVCGLVRVSCAGFYAHIIQCGKSDEETEIYKSVCDICNNKYLCVYRSQHMTMHREQENAKLRKLQAAEKMAQADTAGQAEPEVSGRRRAAEKAKNVIENYNKSMVGEDAGVAGADAGAAGEDADVADAFADADSDVSADIESSSSSSSDFDSAVESDHSLAELVAQRKRKKKKKYPETHTSNIKRIPFAVKNVKAFLAESVDDFRKKYLCADVLYAKWRRCEMTPVPAASSHLYMPVQKHSCQFMIDTKQWTQYELFEARDGKEMSFFVGGCIQWISWAPLRAGDREDSSGSYLAVASHREPDAPRLDAAHVYEHPSMLQIWHFGDMTTAPKLSLCIALDCGTVWAGAWCPSGARDAAAPRARLGLLAVASSSGAAYILPVPYPDTDTHSDKLLYKIKPVAELRFSRGDRTKYQATSVSWSTEKGHSVVVVGYADGSLGYYNIDDESPLLTDEEDGVKIFYPYDEEQRHNSCVTDVAMLVGGGVCSASQSGAALRLRGVVVRSQLPATRAASLRHWPAALVAGNDLIVTHTVNELECWGAGRRLGSLQVCGACECCGAVAAVSPPALRLMRLHPAYTDHFKTDIATIQMTRLNKKKSKLKNDGLSVVIEPRTYEDATKIYGVEFRYLTVKDSIAGPSKEQSCERFPLAESVGVAFCPAPEHHKRLALALYCGLVLLLNV